MGVMLLIAFSYEATSEWKLSNKFQKKILFVGNYGVNLQQKELIDIPEIFRFYEFSFFFYSKEHEPPHVYVEGASGIAIFDWDETQFVLREKHGIKANDMKRIKAVVEENSDIILKRWTENIGKEELI